jgi:hypothetical protein
MSIYILIAHSVHFGSESDGTVPLEIEYCEGTDISNAIDVNSEFPEEIDNRS